MKYRNYVRPLTAFVVFLLVVSAVVQGVGRLGMWLLDDLEGSANAWLDGRATLSGLAGRWDGLNPVASAKRIELPAGWVEQVTVELDVLESVRRNRLVLERLLIEAAELAVERTEGGWRLAGMEPAALEFNLARLLGDIDEIRFNGRLAVSGAAESSLAIEALGVNRDGAHAYDLTVGNPRCDSPCRLDLRWRAKDRAWLRGTQERYLALSGQVVLPAPFVDWLGLETGMHLSADGRWLERGEGGGGGFQVHLDEVGLPGGVTGSFAAELRGSLRDGLREGVLSDVILVAEGTELGLPPVYFKRSHQGTEYWAEQLRLGELAGFMTVALDGVASAREWLGALEPKGELLNVHALVEPTGISYAATFDALRVEPYRGVPWVRQAAGEIIGYGQGARLTMNSEAMGVRIPDVFTDQWRWENMQGDLHAWFGDGYTGMRVPWFRLQAQGNRLSGSFVLARPAERMDQRVAMLVNADRLDVEQARTYIPYHLSDGLQRWLREGPRSGRLFAPRLAYQGQVHTLPNDRSRRLEIQARISAGEVRYHEDWPLVTEVEGFVALAGSETHARVDSAKTLSAEIRDSTVFLGDGGAFAQVALEGEVDTGGGLDFVRASPLAEWLGFVTPDWDGTGRLALSGDLYVPIDDANPAPVDCRLDVALADVSLVLPEYRVRVEELNGPVRYRFPHYLDADPLPASVFGRPASVLATSDDDSIDFHFTATATESDVYRLIDANDPGLATGQMAIDAVLSIAVDDRTSTMMLTSDLVGLEIDLPGEFAKPGEGSSPTRVDLEFLEDHVLVHLNHGALSGWLHVDEVPLRGAIGVYAPAPPLHRETDEVVVSGQVREVDINDWMAANEDADLPMPWRIDSIAADRLRVETVVFENVRIAGNSRDDALNLAFSSTDLVGRMESTGEEPLVLLFESIRLPASEEDGDPLDVSLLDRLPDADVTIDSLTVGDEDYGNWSFSLRRRHQGVLVGDLRASLKGTEISAPDGVFWNASTDRSGGAVSLTMEDLAEVLPQWDYAPSLEAESAELQIDASWPGSPLNVEVNGLRGDVSFRAKNGSFVEVSGGGALRIMALLNINTFFKRMSLNFRDVTAKGTSFDTVKADTRFDDGLLTFAEPAKVKGSGSDFKLGGSVNLVDGVMNDNEMIVTLPVSDSLPWYAVYISLANPVAAAAVLAGQQVLKKQIKQFSSAKYQISGPWEDPDVKLVGIWNDDMQDFDELAQEQEVPGLPNEIQTEGGR